jgi:hypothetical protein
MSGAEELAAPVARKPSGPTALVAPMRRVLVIGGIAAAIALPVAALLGYLAAGPPGAWGALIGMAIPVGFFAITAVTALLTARMSATSLGAVVLGSWLLKIVLLLVVLALLRQADFYNRMALFICLLVGTAGLLTLEGVIVVRTRVPYVEPAPRG